jgi:hypothetical protein
MSLFSLSIKRYVPVFPPDPNPQRKNPSVGETRKDNFRKKPGGSPIPRTWWK